MLALAATLSAVIGLTLGLLGGGGSILTVPMLVYVVKLDPREAIASSLFVVGTTSLVGVVAHARAGRVAWRVGGLFGAAGMAGAYLGGRAARFVPATLLLVLFAVMMLLTSAAMLRGRRGGPSGEREVAVVKALLLGLAVGAFSGLVGAGGGFLVVPALSLLGGLPMPRAIATSLLVIALQSLAGFAGHVAHVSLHLPLLAVITTASIAGSVVGARLASRANPETLRRGFGWLVLAMGVFLLGKQLPAGPARDYGTPAAVLVVVALAVVFLGRRRAASGASTPAPDPTPEQRKTA